MSAEMRLYSGTSGEFITDTVHNQIADKLKLAFFNYFGYNPSEGEVNSWQNSLRAISGVFQYSRLIDQAIILEYQLPNTSKRLDCMVCGKDGAFTDNAVIIELKQWEKCTESPGENEVQTWVGGREKDVLHPSVQVGHYKEYLMDYETVFYEGKQPVSLHSCAFLHNYPYEPDDEIFSEKFRPAIADSPIFTKDDVDEFSKFLADRVKLGGGLEIMSRIEGSSQRPSKELMNHVSNVIRGIHDYILLDEQLLVYDKVLSLVKNGFNGGKKTMLIVEGGPGTGKSVIAINLMADLLAMHYNAQYATGSKAFTSTLREILGKRAVPQLKYFNSYVHAMNNDVDVIIADEAHRIWNLNISRFTPRDQASDVPVIDHMIRAAKVLVFFVDNRQIIRPNEVGTVSYIQEHALKNNCAVIRYKLESQFRCKGSDAFVNWINNTLGIERTANVLWTGSENFDFRIFSSPHEMEKAIRNRVKSGKTGRMTAGFCWPWSEPEKDGNLVDDIIIDGYRRPWNAKPGFTRLAAGIPQSDLWAHETGGIDQVGCVYTAMGFEFDYVGVIFGGDLVYNLDTQSWEGHPEKSKDRTVRNAKSSFTDFVKNAYRVLLSRGMEGCYVYFTDKDTERFFKSRMDLSGMGMAQMA